ncbi:ribbon-helix-helix domain-containing protein [Geoglobus acetivorans]|uniref:Ribbon-helix-helix protein CopG domain-containing protein n=1 Tax=Geoglobus acetivorans TaxID=565033 RepID=A0A0A7GG53_GEOAI|nr:hypothetical protein GACE_0888 [Geoglobus acetivorans]
MNITVSPILKRELEELVERGYFSNVSDAVRYAIHEMLARFRAEGRLPPDSAEERIRHARLIEEREGELE